MRGFRRNLLPGGLFPRIPGGRDWEKPQFQPPAGAGLRRGAELQSQELLLDGIPASGNPNPPHPAEVSGQALRARIVRSNPAPARNPCENKTSGSRKKPQTSQLCPKFPKKALPSSTPAVKAPGALDLREYRCRIRALALPEDAVMEFSSFLINPSLFGVFFFNGKRRKCERV